MPYPVREDMESMRALWSCVTLHKTLSLHTGQWNGGKRGLQTGKTPPSPLIHTLCPYAGLGAYMCIYRHVGKEYSFRSDIHFRQKSPPITFKWWTLLFKCTLIFMYGRQKSYVRTVWRRGDGEWERRVYYLIGEQGIIGILSSFFFIEDNMISYLRMML